MLRNLGVFLGSSDGADDRCRLAARDLGSTLAARGIGLVYGGGGLGLMGAISDAALEAGGTVCGVIPRFMVDREWGCLGTRGVEMHVVDTMHERKALMADRADAFLAMPGGLGTLEELFEMWTWRALDLHPKPVGLLNVGGLWDPLLEMLHRLTDAGFVSHATVQSLVVTDTVDRAVEEISGVVESLREAGRW